MEIRGAPTVEVRSLDNDRRTGVILGFAAGESFMKFFSRVRKHPFDFER